MRVFPRILLWVSLAAVSALPASAAETTILIIRHGEKPAPGLGQLSCQGLNRALALPRVLLSRYGKPTAIYAPNPALGKEDLGVFYAYLRPLATVEPLAIQAGLPVDVTWGFRDIQPLADRLLAAPEGLQVVAWEHHLGEQLARNLLTQLKRDPGEVPAWASADYDSIYVIRIVRTAEAAARASFTRERQGLDGLPASCP